jgi:hypothetical protein
MGKEINVSWSLAWDSSVSTPYCLWLISLCQFVIKKPSSFLFLFSFFFPFFYYLLILAELLALCLLDKGSTT